MFMTTHHLVVAWATIRDDSDCDASLDALATRLPAGAFKCELSAEALVVRVIVIHSHCHSSHYNDYV